MIRSVRRGHAPNCSSAGSVVGIALVSLVAGAAVLNAWAERFKRPPETPPKVRREADGGVVSWTAPAALLGVDPAGMAAALAAGAQLVGSGAPVEGAQSAPDEVHVAVTARCPARCTGCYLDATPEAEHADLAALDADLAALAALGVFEVALGGGEAPERADAAVDMAVRHGITPNLTTSGFGMTRERAQWLRERVGQVNVSIDGDAAYVASRGWDGRKLAWRAVDYLVEAGVPVGVNTVLTRAVWPELESFARELVVRGVTEWQWLRYKPAGRAVGDYLARRLEPEVLDGLFPRLLAIEAATGLTLRVDCALVPFVVPHLPDAGALARLGVVGCGGGHSFLARTADGAWSPCSFAADRATGEAGEVWRSAPVLHQWRTNRLPEPCASCPAASVCRGGCRVVAGVVTGDAFAPDPECPRVRG